MRILLVGFVALTASCGFTFSRLDNVPPGSALGRTVDVDGKTAVSFTKIGVDSTKRIVRSLDDGNFVVKGLTTGAWLLRMAADEDGDGVPERSAIRAVNITTITTADGKQQLSSVLLGDVSLDGTATLIGTVKDPNGDPAPGARVVVFRNTSDLDAQQSVGVSGFSVDLGAESETGSDARGLFRLPGVNRGKVRVAAVSADGTTASAPVAVDAEPGKIVVVGDVDLVPPSTPPATRPAQVDIVNPASDGTIRIDVVKAGGDPKNASDLLVPSHVAPAGRSIGGFSVPTTVVDVYVTDVGPDQKDRRSGVITALMVTAGTAPIEWGNVELDGGDPCGDPADRDGDGLAALPDPTASQANFQLWVDCAPQCADKFGDASGAASCQASDGNTYDCDDDADGQPDVTEPFACVSLCAGDDADGDGICSSSDSFPQCAQNDPSDPSCSFESHSFEKPKPIYGGEGEGEGEGEGAGGFLAIDLQPVDDWQTGFGDVNLACNDPNDTTDPRLDTPNPQETSFADEGTDGIVLGASSNSTACCTCIERVRTIPLAALTNITSFRGHINTQAAGNSPFAAADMRIKFNQGTTHLEDFMIESDPDGTPNGCVGSFHDTQCNADSPSEPHYVQVQNDGTFNVPLCAIQGADNVEVHLQAYGCGTVTVATSLDSFAIGGPDFAGEGEGEGAGEGEGEGADPCLGEPAPSCTTEGDQTAFCDAHLQALAGCTTLLGNFTIARNVTDLTPLASLVTVNGGLTISNTALTSLTGLEALQSVNSLGFTQNDSLVDISALSGLTTVGAGVNVLGNNALTNLHGLENVADLSNSDITVSFAPSFVDLAAVARQHVRRLAVVQSGIVDLTGWSDIVNPEIDVLDLETNANLTSLSGLAVNGGLSVPTSVTLKDNPLLSDATALNGLVSLGDLDIENCPGIGTLTFSGVTTTGAIILKNMASTDLPLFPNVTTTGTIDLENFGMGSLANLVGVTLVNGDVVLKGNAQLTTTGGFGPPTITGVVDAENNANLPSCQVDDIALRAGITSTETNTGNSPLASGCG